jgi:transposase
MMKKNPDLAFLNEVSSVPLQQALRHQHQAFSAFFAGRIRYPRLKSRRGRQSAHYTRSAFSLRGGVLRLAKTAAPAAVHLELAGHRDRAPSGVSRVVAEASGFLVVPLVFKTSERRAAPLAGSIPVRLRELPPRRGFLLWPGGHVGLNDAG